MELPEPKFTHRFNWRDEYNKGCRIVHRVWRILLAGLWLVVQPGVFGQHLRILQTADLHGRIMGGRETDADWLRLATLIETKRQEAGAENLLLIDCGDTIQGSFVSAHSRGEVAVAMLRHLAYDVWALGNHELDFGIVRMVELTRQVGDMVLNGNLRVTRSGYETEYPAFRVFERGGLRVAVFGANSGFLENWHWGEHVKGYRVESALAMLEREMAGLHETADIDLVVLAIHQGWMFRDPRGVNQIREIVERFPEIDLVLGAHTHRAVAGRRIGRRSWYVQAGPHAESLAVVDIDYDRKSREIRNISSYLVEVGDDIRRCPQAAAAVRPWLEPARAAAREVVGSAAEAITARGRPGRSSRTSELLSRALAAATDAEIVIHGRLSGHDLPAGEITREDVFRIVPYENAVGIVDLRKPELVAVVEEQLAMYGSYVACGVYGVFVEFDRENRVVELYDRERNPLPAADRLYRTAFNSYTLAGGGGRFPVLREIVERAREQGRVEDPGLWSRDAVVEYLRANPDLTVKPVRWLL